MKILVVEDELAIRNNLQRMLALEDFEVQAAANGREALSLVKEFRPDLILCDVMMPELDGFGVLAALREDDQTEAIPLVFLTALDDRENLRRAMGLGADDYLTKPFSRDDVLRAIDTRMARAAAAQRREARHLQEREAQLTAMFQQSILGDRSLPVEVDAVEGRSAEMREATVLFSDIRGFTTISEQLSAQEVAEMLNAYFRAVCEPILAARGEALRFIGDGVMAVFSADQAAGNEAGHAYRGVQAALGMALAAARFADWLATRFAGRGLPPFAIGIGVHTGPVMMCYVGSGERREFTAIGDTVNLASRLEGQTKKLGWPVIASLQTVHAAGQGISFGEIETLTVKGRHATIDAVQITGIEVAAGVADGGRIEWAAEVRNALRRNAEITGRAVKAALAVTLPMASQPVAFDPAVGLTPQIKGYRVLRKLGEGSMSRVLLAERESDGAEVALKILTNDPHELGDRDDMLARFIQEYAIISRIAHANVVRIHEQSFSDELAYIAMEYFPAGDLLGLIARGMSPQRVVDVVVQTAYALAEVHRHGIVHRDLKPNNLMVRSDGSIALADFGVAKGVGPSLAMTLAKTRHGQVVGTPYYLSPEQATTGAVSNKSDLYSLGVLAYEMFTGEKPYRADSVDALLRLHVYAELPKLPPPLAGYQQLIDRLMAKDPAVRFQSADEVVAFLTGDCVDAAGRPCCSRESLADSIRPVHHLPLNGAARAASPCESSRPLSQ
ncbi:MAG: protein kinase [Betaproteobacteria bacterium]|nr:protein kinase [Betaproteobacteria bacterium]